MKNTEKVYEPETIVDQPLPDQIEEDESVSQGTGDQTYSQKTINDQVVPSTKVAQEVRGLSFDTISKKIRQAYEFTKSGALKIGEYVNGVSGEVKLSPDGILARNKDGDTTFAVDGDTGDAIFKGTVQAADFIIADENGLVSLNNFSKSSTESGVVSQNITTSEPNWTDITSSEINIELNRAAIILFLAKITYKTYAGGSGYQDALIRFLIDGSYPGGRIFTRTPSNYVTSSMHMIIQLSKGLHAVKLQATVNRDTGSPELDIYNYTFSYLILGT